MGRPAGNPALLIADCGREGPEPPGRSPVREAAAVAGDETTAPNRWRPTTTSIGLRVVPSVVVLVLASIGLVRADRIGPARALAAVFLLGAAVVNLLVAARAEAVVTTAGLHVRNVLGGRTYAWATVKAVDDGKGLIPTVLALRSGRAVPVLAVGRPDREAFRRVVEAHTGAGEP